MMKKILALVLAVALVFCLAACGAKKDDKTVKVGATPAPHAEILEIAKEIMAEEGYTLDIVEFEDYVQPNTAVESGDLDANYFQHILYMGSFNEENGTHLVAAAEIHYEPFGIYAGKTASIEELADGAKIAVPNDGTNEARALLLLEEQGLIKLADGVGLEATKLDIVDNPKNLEIVEMEAAQLTGALTSVDLAVINGNYAIAAGLSAMTDALVTEDANSEVIKSNYVNILAVKEGNENNEGIKALIKALQSEKVKTFINDKYDGAVVPMF